MPPKTEVRYDVYIVRNAKSKPVKVGSIPGNQLPATYKHEGTTYYFATADLSEKWVSFSAVPPNFGT